jgi:hypothetical protein
MAILRCRVLDNAVKCLHSTGPRPTTPERLARLQQSLCTPKAAPGTTSGSYTLRSRSVRGPRRCTLGRTFRTHGDHTSVTYATSIGGTCISSRATSCGARNLVVRITQSHAIASSWELRQTSRPQSSELAHRTAHQRRGSKGVNMWNRDFSSVPRTNWQTIRVISVLLDANYTHSFTLVRRSNREPLQPQKQTTRPAQPRLQGKPNNRRQWELSNNELYSSLDGDTCA